MAAAQRWVQGMVRGRTVTEINERVSKGIVGKVAVIITNVLQGGDEVYIALAQMLVDRARGDVEAQLGDVAELQNHLRDLERASREWAGDGLWRHMKG